MNPRRISTDREGARALGRLMRPGASPQRLRPAAIPPKAGVVVEIVSEIPAGDYGQHQAKLLAVQGGQWQDTGNTVPVRHVGESAVPAETRVIVEPCGRLGLCFARTDNGRPEVQIPVNRMTRATGPQAGYFGDEDLSWGSMFGPNDEDGVRGTLLSQYVNSPGFAHWQIQGPYSDTPDSITQNGISWNAVWNRKLYPMRFRIDDHSDIVKRWYARNWRPYYFNRDIYDNSRRYAMLAQVGGADDYGPSSYTLDDTSHLWPMTLSELSLAVPVFWIKTWGNHEGQPTRRLYHCDLNVRAYRVWIDGADQTGVVSATFANKKSSPADDNHPGQWMLTPITAAITAAQHQRKTVEWDIWLNATFRVTSADVDSGGSPILPSSDYFMGYTREDGVAAFTQLLYANAYQNLTGREVWDLTLADVTVGGQSTLTTEASASWTWQRSTGQDVWYFSNNDAVSFEYFREVPIVYVYIDAEAFPDDAIYNTGAVVYAPEDSADYATTRFLFGGEAYTPGVWDPAAATTFVPIGVEVQGYFYVLSPALLPTINNYPTTITVEPA